jgi:hypothetical protein
VSASGGNGNGNGNGNGFEPGPTYRRCVGVCVVNAKNEVFVARRADLPSVEEAKQYASGGKHERVAWQMPQVRHFVHTTSSHLIGEDYCCIA